MPSELMESAPGFFLNIRPSKVNSETLFNPVFILMAHRYNHGDSKAFTVSMVQWTNFDSDV